AHHEIGFAEQIRTGRAVTQNQPDEVRQRRLAEPALAPRKRAAWRDAPEYEGDVQGAFDQDHGILWRNILKARAWSRPGGAPSHEARHLASGLDRQGDDFLA